MSIKYCIWCEIGNEPEGDYFWIHKHCFEAICDTSSDIEHVKKMLDEKKSIPEIIDFLKSMEDFRRRWNNSVALISELMKEPKQGRGKT
jgi:hypothetical protein